MKMRSLFAVAALATCTAGVAMAADLPMRSPPPAPFVPPPLFTWSGFYAGVNAGASFDNQAGLTTPTGFAAAGLPGAPVGGFGSFRGAGSGVGFVGGGQIGYNIQNGMFVYGLEADIDYFGGGGGGTRTFDVSGPFGAAGSTFALTRKDDAGYLGTVRGRLGLAAFDRTLLYVTGGLAYGNYGTGYRVARLVDNFGVGSTRDFTGGSDDTRIGYTIGAGMEYALTQNISAKVEYLYTDLGSRNYTLTNPDIPAATVKVRDSGTSQLARVGLNYKF